MWSVAGGGVCQVVSHKELHHTLGSGITIRAETTAVFQQHQPAYHFLDCSIKCQNTFKKSSKIILPGQQFKTQTNSIYNDIKHKISKNLTLEKLTLINRLAKLFPIKFCVDRLINLIIAALITFV